MPREENPPTLGHLTPLDYKAAASSRSPLGLPVQTREKEDTGKKMVEAELDEYFY